MSMCYNQMSWIEEHGGLINMEKSLWEQICLICDKIRFELWVMLLLTFVIGFFQPILVIPAILLVSFAAIVRESHRSDVNLRVRNYVNNIVAGIDHTRVDATMLNTYPESARKTSRPSRSFAMY